MTAPPRHGIELAASLGTKVVLTARRVTQLTQTADEITANSGQAIYQQVDVTVNALGHMDVLVNDAGLLAIADAIEQPAEVDINDIVLRPTVQAFEAPHAAGPQLAGPAGDSSGQRSCHQGLQRRGGAPNQCAQLMLVIKEASF